MRAVLVLASVLSLSVVVACAGTEASPAPSPAKDTDDTHPAPVAPPAPATSSDAGGQDDEDAAAPKNECKLAAMTSGGAVIPEFTIGSPPAMTGGALDGEYTVDGATVFLPTGSAGLVDPDKSSGSVDAWAKFDGASYRLHLKSDFTIATAYGPQSSGVDTESQGGFTTKSEVLLLDHACDGAIGDEADYSFTDEGNGRATILIKTPTPYGDVYLRLDAAKS